MNETLNKNSNIKELKVVVWLKIDEKVYALICDKEQTKDYLHREICDLVKVSRKLYSCIVCAKLFVKLKKTTKGSLDAHIEKDHFGVYLEDTQQWLIGETGLIYDSSHHQRAAKKN